MGIIHRLPFGFFYGYEDEVSAGIVEDEAKYIYYSLLKDENAGEKIMNNPPEKISIFSEYDYIDLYFYNWLCTIGQKKANDQIKGLSLRSFRKKITEECIGQEEYIGLLPSDLREITNLFRDNPAKLFVYIINEVMYDTERKQKYLQAIEEWKSQLIKFEIPSAN